ncbi:Oidioi.mRNA.OKI2018_I69.PAR.g8644.t1.cds [Oikopleura dioica]|uniref:Oidioi.mRNA.OKI2018_I69.PAR.g8644.t1.cds n=1 Tax=Oikopleura dioica TaxID=34765 RepID=A0ABN7RL66_OIKDI|nr:Oidioi.mRNA.OKI2018_I69.PAR.g8644.t1.cds [Oikopleura dioica]
MKWIILFLFTIAGTEVSAQSLIERIPEATVTPRALEKESRKKHRRKILKKLDSLGLHQNQECTIHDDCPSRRFCFRLENGHPFGKCHKCLKKKQKCTEDIECCQGEGGNAKNECRNGVCSKRRKKSSPKSRRTRSRRRRLRCLTQKSCKHREICARHSKHSHGFCHTPLAKDKPCSPKPERAKYRRPPCADGLACLKNGKKFTCQ